MKKYAVIVAGGSGSRMNNALPKQFLPLKDKPVIYYTLDIFLKAYSDLEVILVLPGTYIETGKEIINTYFESGRISLVAGGETRFHSVKNGLTFVTPDSIVFVHDGVRCLLSTDLIHRCYEAAVEFGSAIPMITSKDSVRVVNDSGNKAIDRNFIKLVQTPQTFKANILLQAFEQDFKERFTDEATVVEAAGHKIHLVEGEENNIKITRPQDMLLAAQIITGR